MTLLSRLSLAAVISVLTLFIAACSGTNVQVVRIPFISPVVVPDLNPPNEMLMNLGVQNYNTSKAAPPVWLEIHSEYGVAAQGAPFPCTQDDWISVGALGPGQGWGLPDYRIDHGSQSCACLKNSRPGHLWASLHVAPNYAPILPGPGTNLHVNWASNGDLKGETVTDCSAPPTPVPPACQ